MADRAQGIESNSGASQHPDMPRLARPIALHPGDNSDFHRDLHDQSLRFRDARLNPNHPDLMEENHNLNNHVAILSGWVRNLETRLHNRAVGDHAECNRALDRAQNRIRELETEQVDRQQQDETNQEQTGLYYPSTWRGARDVTPPPLSRFDLKKAKIEESEKESVAGEEGNAPSSVEETRQEPGEQERAEEPTGSSGYPWLQNQAQHAHSAQQAPQIQIPPQPASDPSHKSALHWPAAPASPQQSCSTSQSSQPPLPAVSKVPSNPFVPHGQHQHRHQHQQQHQQQLQQHQNLRQLQQQLSWLLNPPRQPASSGPQGPLIPLPFPAAVAPPHALLAFPPSQEPIDDLKAVGGKNKTQLQECLKGSRKTVEVLKGKVATLEAENVKIRKALQAQDGHSQVLDLMTENVRIEKTRLEQEMKKKDGSIRALQQNVILLEDRSKDSSRQLVSLKAQLEAQFGSFKAAEEKIAGLEATLMEKEEVIKKQALLMKSKEEKKSFKATVQAEMQRMAEKQVEERNLYQEKMVELKAAHKEKEKEWEEERGTIAARVKNLLDEKTIFEKTLETMAMELAAQKKELATTHEEKKSWNTERENVVQKMNKLEAIMKKVEDESKKKDEEAERLRKEKRESSESHQSESRKMAEKVASLEKKILDQATAQEASRRVAVTEALNNVVGVVMTQIDSVNAPIVRATMPPTALVPPSIKMNKLEHDSNHAGQESDEPSTSGTPSTNASKRGRSRSVTGSSNPRAKRSKPEEPDERRSNME